MPELADCQRRTSQSRCIRLTQPVPDLLVNFFRVVDLKMMSEAAGLWLDNLFPTR